MEDQVLGKWTEINYACPSHSGLTHHWLVQSNHSHAYLGEVRWFSQWRQYVFAPAVGTVWNPECMDEISKFVREQTRQHRTSHDG